MNEDGKDQNDQPDQDNQQPSVETQTELRKISKEELKQILEDHKKWLESIGEEGTHADISKADLQEADLHGVKLQKAFLIAANLQQADLHKADLQDTFLTQANLQEANLNNTNLQHANLMRANLQNARLVNANLQYANLIETDLQRAVLILANLEHADINKANLQQAILRQANLHNTNLIEADLQRTVLIRANLQEANLNNTNLQHANLMRANLQKANLFKADMQDTVLDGIEGLNKAKDLKYANFQGATGLLGNEFAQADVTGTKLPDDIKEFKALETVEKTSQNARKIFFAMLLGCVYSWLTIATTTDVRLLTNTASSPLPIIQTEIPIVGFYITAPLILLCLYFYFHLYLDNLWKGLASLPAIFPDGKPLDQTAYPWLLNSLVCRHFERLKKRAELKELEGLKVKIEKILKRVRISREINIRPIVFYLKEWITILLAWWVVPITMMAFWLRYISRHDWLGTCLHIGLIFFSIAFAIYFYRLCALTLQGKEKVAFRLKEFWCDRRTLYGLITVAFSFMLILFSVYTFTYKGADFREKAVSERPINYWEISKDERLESVKGANLKGRNLKNADMYEAFLVKADLRGALLNGSMLFNANLQQANLANANLRQANLRLANLQEASFLRSNLQEADLRGAKNLKIDRLSQVKTLYKAKLDPELSEKVKKCCFHLLEKPKEEPDKSN